MCPWLYMVPSTRITLYCLTSLAQCGRGLYKAHMSIRANLLPGDHLLIVVHHHRMFFQCFPIKSEQTRQLYTSKWGSLTKLALKWFIRPWTERQLNGRIRILKYWHTDTHAHVHTEAYTQKENVTGHIRFIVIPEIPRKRQLTTTLKVSGGILLYPGSVEENQH